MIKYSGNTINDWYCGASNLIKMYRNGAVVYQKIGASSPTPPTPPTFDGKWLATYSDSSTQSAACNVENTIIAYGDIDTNNLVAAEVGSCVTELRANESYYGAFDSAASLTSVTLNEGLQIIGVSTFYGCTSLPSITIPNSVTSIGNGAFFQCTSLANVTIGSSVTSIDASAFAYCSSLTSITIPNSVTSIGAGAFSDCESLASITIPNSVTSIGGSAFQMCRSLSSVAIPNSVTRIDSSAFAYCNSLTNIAIGSGVTSIGRYAFRNCTSLTSITVEATTPPTLVDANAFFNTNDCQIYVPSGSVELYKTANNWFIYASRIQPIE